MPGCRASSISAGGVKWWTDPQGAARARLSLRFLRRVQVWVRHAVDRLPLLHCQAHPTQEAGLGLTRLLVEARAPRSDTRHERERKHSHNGLLDILEELPECSLGWVSIAHDLQVSPHQGQVPFTPDVRGLAQDEEVRQVVCTYRAAREAKVEGANLRRTAPGAEADVLGSVIAVAEGQRLLLEPCGDLVEAALAHAVGASKSGVRQHLPQ
mmetsp:Transcript_116436/g.340619  ORF Transcript_116436/g.340619 Transcript_116436/m.340619 type:complete len:211 (-) Transcript_116436:672-1304(-)